MADLNAVLRIRAVDKATGALKAVNRRMRKLTDNIKKSHKAARGMSAEYTKMAGSIQLASQGVQSAGRRMLEAIRGTAREAVSFDDAMADVRKVVGFDSERVHAILRAHFGCRPAQ